jgi:hypothetical protein
MSRLTIGITDQQHQNSRREARLPQIWLKLMALMLCLGQPENLD